MLADPLSLTHAATSVTTALVRTSQEGSSSGWVSTDIPGLRAKISHTYSGKNGSTKRSLLQLQRTTNDSEGNQEIVTVNLTLAGPSIRRIVTDNQLRDLLSFLQMFVTMGASGWTSNEHFTKFLRGEY